MTPPPSDAGDTTRLEIENANVSAVFLECFEGVGMVGGQVWGNNAFVATQTRSNETRTLRPQTVYRSTGNTIYNSPVPQRAGQLGSVVPLFVGYQNGAGISARLTHL